MLDPGSAQFENVHVSTVSASRAIGVVCGEINGKNVLGGYSGFRRFVYGRDSGMAVIENDPDSVGDGTPEFGAALARNVELFNMTWDNSCR